MNGNEAENAPDGFERALGVAGIVASTPVIWLGMTGLFLVAGSLILNDSRTRQDFWFAHFCIAFLSVLLIYGGYRFEIHARRPRHTSNSAPSTAEDSGKKTGSLHRSNVLDVEPQSQPCGWLFNLFKRRKFGSLSASPFGLFVFIALPASLVVMVSAPRGPLQAEVISSMLYEGDILKNKVSEFHRLHRKLPQSSEAKAFALAPPELWRAQSVVWDPAERMIVVTASEPWPSKRFALQAEEREGALLWTCRTIDFPVKRLPGRCR